MTAYGHRFQAHHVANLRQRWKIPRYERKVESADGELWTVKKAAVALDVATSSMSEADLRWRTGRRVR